MLLYLTLITFCQLSWEIAGANPNIYWASDEQWAPCSALHYEHSRIASEETWKR